MARPRTVHSFSRALGAGVCLVATHIAGGSTAREPAQSVPSAEVGAAEPSLRALPVVFENAHGRIEFGAGVYQFQITAFRCGMAKNESTGSWRANGGWISFEGDWPKPPSDVRIVPWGARLYLVPRDGLERFCAAVQTGVEPRASLEGYAYLRAGDERIAALGLPDLPEPWNDLVRLPPIATVLIPDPTAPPCRPARDETGAWQCVLRYPEAIVAGGWRHGLRPGVRLFSATGGAEDEWTVTDVGAEQSRAVLSGSSEMAYIFGRWKPPAAPVAATSCAPARRP